MRLIDLMQLTSGLSVYRDRVYPCGRLSRRMTRRGAVTIVTYADCVKFYLNGQPVSHQRAQQLLKQEG